MAGQDDGAKFNEERLIEDADNQSPELPAHLPHSPVQLDFR